MNCVYCQLGASLKTTVRRKEFVPAAEVLAQVKTALRSGQRIEAITFSGSGEPGLHSGIGKIIHGLKKMTNIPVVVLTNSSSLVSKKGRQELAEADIVVPSLDAATPRIFKKINRPHPALTVGRIIDGLVKFRREYRGQLWLEVMLVRGTNDGLTHLRKLKEAVSRIRPDKIQLNTVVRPPAERSARPLSRRELEGIAAFFGRDAEIIADFTSRKPTPVSVDIREAILATVGRRPVTARDIALSLGKPLGMIRKHLSLLRREGKVKPVVHEKSKYYKKIEAPRRPIP